jgi:hypothetical protein
MADMPEDAMLEKFLKKADISQGNFRKCLIYQKVPIESA